MGRLYKIFLSGKRVYSCQICYDNSQITHLAENTQVISKAFQRSGKKAYLFKECNNVILGEFEDRILLNGLHTVANIYCLQCNSILGWKYIEAYEETEEYKIGKFLIERAKIRKEIGWNPSVNNNNNNSE